MFLIDQYHFKLEVQFIHFQFKLQVIYHHLQFTLLQFSFPQSIIVYLQVIYHPTIFILICHQ
jgi:hypothetical protein